MQKCQEFLNELFKDAQRTPEVIFAFEVEYKAIGRQVRTELSRNIYERGQLRKLREHQMAGTCTRSAM
jgi:hypothetical protein